MITEGVDQHLGGANVLFNILATVYTPDSRWLNPSRPAPPASPKVTLGPVPICKYSPAAPLNPCAGGSVLVVRRGLVPLNK